MIRSNDYIWDWDEYKKEQENKPKIEWNNPEIFKLSLKETEQLILNKLDYITSYIISTNKK